MARRVTWSQYRESIGDHTGLFTALLDRVPVHRALYPGSYVDLSSSTVIGSVTYVDTDARAARFFADSGLVAAELAGKARPGAGQQVRFLAADYTHPLDVPDGSMALLISLFDGPVMEHCHHYLRPGGWLLANTSRGDASLAALDPALRLIAVAHHQDDHDSLSTDRLGEYLIPKRPESATADRIRATGRGIAYTSLGLRRRHARRVGLSLGCDGCGLEDVVWQRVGCSFAGEFEVSARAVASMSRWA